MPIADFLIIATFTHPGTVQTNASSMLWLLPLAAAIAIIYKATKLPTITPANFIKETILLFSSIVIFIFIVASALYALMCLIME